jgi:hypothetical protein
VDSPKIHIFIGAQPHVDRKHFITARIPFGDGLLAQNEWITFLSFKSSSIYTVP